MQVIDFFRGKKFKTNRQRRIWRISFTIAIFVCFILGVLIGGGSVYFYRQIDEARINVLASLDAWKDFQLDLARSRILSTGKNILTAKKILRLAKPLTVLPWLGDKVRAGEGILDNSLQALNSYDKAVTVTGKLEKYKDQSYGEIADKEEVISALGELINALEEVYKSAHAILAGTHELGISDFELVKKFEDEFSKFKEEDFELLHIIHNIASKKEEQTFLLLMQNNTELRPTGGYIGNFGVLRIKAGEVREFYLKDTDELNEDKSRIDKSRIIPPQLLAKYFRQAMWRFGDANWSPSFVESARNAQELYNIEIAKNSSERTKFDGIIAFNPELVNDWLKVVGGVTIAFTEDIKYTTDNFSDTPQNFYPGEVIDGKVIKKKTYIVDAIAQEVRRKMLDSSIITILQLLTTLRHNIEDNNLFFYFNKPELQAVLVQNGWTGELLKSDRDYLYVVDANLSWERLDHMIKRLISYRVSREGVDYIANLELSYDYNAGREETEGLFEEDLLGYRTYTRIYVPLGAELVNYEGARAVDTFTDLDKTVFGVLITVAPSKQTIVKLTYKLPAAAASQGYQLVLQRQPGNEFTDFKITLPGCSGSVFEPSAGQLSETKDFIIWQGKLNEDRQFAVK